MTSIGVTNRTSAYNRATEAHDGKRRSERLVRVSGHPYTIVRPRWFDYNRPDELRLVLLQGDTRRAGDPSDGVIARRQIAQVLIRGLGSDAAIRKTFELVAERGPAPNDFDALFAPLQAEPPGSLDGAQDVANMPLNRRAAASTPPRAQPAKIIGRTRGHSRQVLTTEGPPTGTAHRYQGSPPRPPAESDTAYRQLRPYRPLVPMRVHARRPVAHRPRLSPRYAPPMPADETPVSDDRHQQK